MNFLQLKEFFINFSASTIAIASAIAIAKHFVIKVIKNETGKKIVRVSPFPIGILCTFIIDCIINKNLCFTEQTFVSGLMAGSLSFCISLLINKVLSGEMLPFTQTQLMISGLLENYVDKSVLQTVACSIEKIVLESADEDGIKSDEVKIQLIVEVITDNHNGSLTALDITCLAQIILTSIEDMTKGDKLA